MTESPAPRVLLASQSPYRRELLGRLLADFAAIAPRVDESGEAPADLARRLAALKARAGAELDPGAIVVASDQVAALGQEVLGKPGTPERAVEQLLRCAGHSVEFLTAVCVLAPGRPAAHHLDVTRVQFRPFGPDQARRYVAADQPLDCAGSFKAEKRGVVLMSRMDSSDPTAIQGLPLIWLAGVLEELGVACY
jgi:septum formation protein